MGPSLCIGTSIAAILDSFAKLIFATHFPALRGGGNLPKSSSLQIILAHVALHMLKSSRDAYFFDASCSIYRASTGSFLFVFPVGTAGFHFVSQDHSQVLHISMAAVMQK